MIIKGDNMTKMTKKKSRVYKYSLIALICLGVIGLGIAFDAYTGFPASDGDTLTASMVNALANNLESLTDVIQDSGPDLTAVADVCNSAGDCLSTVSGGASLPSGMVIAHAGSACPSGWLLANGGSLATATYPDLFAAIGYMYGGSGANFNKPDYRGNFLRGYSGGSAADPNRAARLDRGDGTTGNAVGTRQNPMLGSHLHSVDPPNRVTTSNGAHTHLLRIYKDTPDFNAWNAYLRTGAHGNLWNSDITSSIQSAGNHQHNVNIPAFNSAANGGAETRPINVYVLYCIKT